MEPARPSGFLVINRLDGDHPIHVGTTGGGNGNGAHLTAGGVWTNASSRSFKERFVQYRPAEVLERIRQLPVEGYFYKGTEEYHITPMAEDFYRLFGTGVREIIETDSTGQLVRRPNPDVDKYLAASDVAGVALLGVKALDERISTLGPQSTAWALTGNAITGTEFLGTTNAQPLVIRTDNTERMRVTATGDVGIGTTHTGGEAGCERHRRLLGNGNADQYWKRPDAPQQRGGGGDRGWRWGCRHQRQPTDDGDAGAGALHPLQRFAEPDAREGVAEWRESDCHRGVPRHPDVHRGRLATDELC
jgi:hypothetical protein